MTQNVENDDTAKILARNLLALMQAEGSPAASAQQIAKKTGAEVSPNTVLNMLNPERGISATLDSLDQVARVFGCAAWELLHPDINQIRLATKLVEVARDSDHPPPLRTHQPLADYHKRRR